MTNDYGRRAKPKKLPIIWIAVALAAIATLVAASFVPAWVKERNQAVGEAQAWNLQGAPCPALSEQAFAAGYSTPQGLDFGEVRFERQYGHASCATLHYDGGRSKETYPACQFMAPSVLTVVSPKGRFHFAPGLGQSATVFIEHDQPRCVLAINKAMF